MTQHDVRSVELPTGVKLQYVERGDPSGAAVLLLHGLADSWRSFERLLPVLPESIHAFAPTQRGHGDSDRPASGYRVRDFAADVAAFMDALQIEAAVVVGHSMGSAVAKRFAIDHPKRVRGLIVEGAWVSTPNNEAIRELWDSKVSKLTDPVDPGFVREFAESAMARPVPRDFFETIVRENLKLPARVWKGVVESFLKDDFAGELNRIEAPTLIVWGDRDSVCFRSEQEAQTAAIPGSRLVTYHGMGHSPHWEEPERFAADLAAFVETAARRAASPPVHR
jgi:non-heme chloroperoxidase